MQRGWHEITDSHPNYPLLECIRGCFKKVIGEKNVKAKFHLTSEDYGESQKVDCDVKFHEKVTFTVHAPAVFSTIRAAFGVGKNEFINNISPEKQANYFKYVSNSSGKHDFYFTQDKRFIFKTEPKRTLTNFLYILEDYLNHFIKNPHSLIVKIFGA